DGHSQASMRHSHTSVINTTWQQKRLDTMTKPLHRGGEGGMVPDFTQFRGVCRRPPLVSLRKRAPRGGSPLCTRWALPWQGDAARLSSCLRTTTLCFFPLETVRGTLLRAPNAPSAAPYQALHGAIGVKRGYHVSSTCTPTTDPASERVVTRPRPHHRHGVRGGQRTAGIRRDAHDHPVLGRARACRARDRDRQRRWPALAAPAGAALLPQPDRHACLCGHHAGRRRRSPRTHG